MEAKAEVQSGTLEHEGAQIYYEAAGEGHPVVFLHAGIADRRMWDKQMGPFAKRYRVIRYDQRGYGRTTAAAGPHSHVRDLAAVLDHLRVGRAHLVGCSKGGRLAFDCTLAQAERVSALVMVNSGAPGFEFSGGQPRQWDELVAAFKAGDLARTNELEIQVWIDGALRTPEQVNPAVRALALEMNGIALANEAAGLGEEERPPDGTGRLGEIRAPFLAIASDLDDPNFTRAAEFAAANVPGGQMAVIRGAAHLPSLEQPEAFNRAVLDFLAPADAPAPAPAG